MAETIVHRTCFKEYFTIRNTLCCIQSIIDCIDCAEHAFREKELTKLDLLLWHDYYFQLHKTKTDLNPVMHSGCFL